mgnify:CR=1 FL=1
MSKRLMLVDGSGYIFRAYHALPSLTRSDGTPVGAVRGFSSMLLRLVDDHPDDDIAVIFDASGNTFRNNIYDLYKANREAPPEDLRPQFSLVRDATRAFNLPCVEQLGYEADDLIATYAIQAVSRGQDVIVVSSDKDLMQLIQPGIGLWDPMKQKALGADECLEKFGVQPDKVIDVQSLAGDSVDNVPGVPGIGVKTAALLINEYGDLDSLLARAGEIKQNKRRENLIEFADQARISRELVTLKTNVPLDVPLTDLAHPQRDLDKLRDFLEIMEFSSLAAKLGLEIKKPVIVTPSPKDEIVPEVSALGACQYALVDTEALLLEWIAKCQNSRVVGFDTETTSLDSMQADLVGISLAVGAGEACYVPLAHKPVEGELLGEKVRQVSVERGLALLKPMLENPAILKIGHNLKYDYQVLRRYGVCLSPVDDSCLLSFVLDGGKHNHGLDELAKRCFEHDTIPFKEVCGSGKSQITFDLVAVEKARDYAAEDADVSLRLWQGLKPRLVTERMSTVYETLERPLIGVISDMEAAGIKVDANLLRRMSGDFAQRSAQLEDEIYQLAGREFTIGSPKQLGEILFSELGLPGGKKSPKTGAYSTDASVLEDLAAQGHELPTRLLDWRQINKLKSTYTDALVTQINPDTGRVHTSYSMVGAQTGRLSSNDPNLQNIPVRTEEGRKIRSAFIAEPGCKIVSIDYSQIELRLTAHMAREQTLQQAFHDGLDIHAITASQMFGVPLDGMDPMVRRNAKAINFGIIYGISSYGLANNLGIGNAEAKNFIDQYFERFPGIKVFMSEAKKFAVDHEYVETLFGRRIHVPGIKDKNFARRGFAERQAINAPIQGTAADIIKRAMIRMPGALKQAGLSGKMLLQVHDELLFECHASEVDALTAVAKGVMERACEPVLTLDVPLIADSGVGDNWMQAH